MSNLLPPEAVILYAGHFGREVLKQLDIKDCTALELNDRLYPAEIPYASLIISIWSGHYGEARDRIYMVGFQRCIPTLGIELLPTSIICGPVVQPGYTACYDCYKRRMQQHQQNTVTMLDNSSDLPEGFGLAEVFVAIGMLGKALTTLNLATSVNDMSKNSAETLGADVYTFDLVHGSTSRLSTVAVDRCPRCSQRFAPRRHPTAALQGLL